MPEFSLQGLLFTKRRSVRPAVVGELRRGLEIG